MAQDTQEAPDAGSSAAAPATVATAARIEALQMLASGEHPGVPLDSVLSVSLDDDSSMIEHDRNLRLKRRNVTIALRSAERFNNKTDEERADMRDQILAMDLERKVLALPIEVRARLIEQDAEGDAQPVEAEQAGSQTAGEDNSDDGEASARPASTERPEAGRRQGRARAPKKVAPAEKVQEDATPYWSLLRVLGWLLGTWLVSRLCSLGLQWMGKKFPDRKERLAELSALAGLFVWLAGGALTLLFGFSLSLEVLVAVLGTLALITALAFKDLAGSLLAGVLLIVQRPFQLGDQVEFDQVQGKVTEIGLTAVRLLTPQQRIVSVPNRVFLTHVVSTTPAATAVTPLQVDFLIDPNQDIPTAKSLVKDAVEEMRSVEMPKSGAILVNQVTIDRMVAVRLRCKLFVMGVQPTAEIRSDLTERVLESFRKAGLRTPAAQLPAA